MPLTGLRQARERVRGGAVFLDATAGFVALLTARWAGTPVTGATVLSAAVTGVALGAIYSLAATGLVVTYTTSGIFNFAQGAIGMLMAFVYWQLTQEVGLGELPAIILVVGVIAPAVGVLLDRFAMSRAARSSLIVQLMTTVALTIFLMGLAAWVWDPGRARSIPYLFGSRGFHVGDTFVLWHRFITIVVGVVVAVGLRILLQRSRAGLAMRAVVDSPTLASLHGARPQRASSLAWALSSSLAALSGILVAPEVLMSVEGLTLIIINAFAAAIIGRLRSLPLTIVGGMVIGLLTSFSLGFLDLSGRWANFSQAIPSIVLFVALLALPAAPIAAGRRQARLHARIPKLGEAAVAGFVLVAVLWASTGGMAVTTQNRLTAALITALILLPLVPIIGWSGQVALAPLTFAGIGAYVMTAHAADGSLWGLVGSAALALPIGIAVALPALRLQGLYFALASVAFARGMELLFFPQSGILAGRFVVVQRPELLGISFKSQRAFLVLTAIALALMAVLLVGVRRSSFGRNLVAMRDSTAACTTVGIDVRKLKLAVFCLSAALGAVGGAFLAMQRGTPSAADFGMFPGLSLVLYLVMGGVTLVSGAFVAGGVNFLFSSVTSTWSGTAITLLDRLGPGGLASAISQNPDGLAGQAARDLSHIVPRGSTSPAAPTPAPSHALDVPLTDAELRRIDDRLGLPSELRGGH